MIWKGCETSSLVIETEVEAAYGFTTVGKPYKLQKFVLAKGKLYAIILNYFFAIMVLILLFMGMRNAYQNLCEVLLKQPWYYGQQ